MFSLLDITDSFSQSTHFQVKSFHVENSQEIHCTYDAMGTGKEATYKKANSVILLKYGS